MEKVRFYPLDVMYKIEGGKAVIHVFGRTAQGKQICVIDRAFTPYFVALPSGNVEGALGKLEYVQKVEAFEKNVLGKKTSLLRVYADLPKNVPELKDTVKSAKGVEDVFEYDILFARRYLIDHGLTPLMLCEAQGSFTPHNASVPVFDATSVSAVGEETLEKPRCLAVDIETYNPDGKKIDPDNYPIIMIALYGDGYEKVLTYKDVKRDFDYVEKLGSESEMLERFAQCVHDYGPDMLVGYNSEGFDLPYIDTRAKKYKLKLKLGLDGSEIDISKRGTKKVTVTGIVHADLLPFIRRVVGRTLKTDSYKLDNVAEEILGEKKIDVDMDAMAGHWDKNTPELAKYVEYNLKDAELTYRLAFEVLPQMIELVKLVGMPLYDVMRMSFSQLVEWFLIKQAQEYGEVIPNKPRYSESSIRIDERAKGGFVYEPTPGLYENISVFDFRSLYPSIIVSHNISVETVNCECCREKVLAPVEDEKIWFCKKKKGFLSSVLKSILERRSRVKELMKEKGKDPLLAARSEGLKVMANSFYGYLGFAPARWYSFACVRSITAWGRSYINNVISKAEDRGFKVVYGDTDSVFLQLDGKHSEKEALSFMEEVNRDLPGMMELEFEGLFKSGIFVGAKGSDVGAKKRYALMNQRGELVVKGFEIVRRNYSGIGKDAQRSVLTILLGEKDVDKALKYIREKVKALKSGNIDVEELVISTKLTKKIEDYGAIGPHVAAAKLMVKAGVDVGAGQLVRYVVCKGAGKIRDKVKLPEDVEGTDVDSDYYIDHQILPAVEKIFEVFDISHDQLVKESSQSSLDGFF